MEGSSTHSKQSFQLVQPLFPENKTFCPVSLFKLNAYLPARTNGLGLNIILQDSLLVAPNSSLQRFNRLTAIYPSIIIYNNTNMTCMCINAPGNRHTYILAAKRNW